MNIRFVVISLLATIGLSACGAQPLPLPTTQPGGAAPAAALAETTTSAAPAPSGGGVAHISGDIELSQTDYIPVYFTEPFVILQDMTGFVKRDLVYRQPENSQVLGQVTIDKDGKITYVLNLPEVPTDPLNDVDQNGKADAGVQIWQVMFDGNFIGSSFATNKDEFSDLGWGVNWTSAKINVDDKYEVNGGKLVVWAPDDQQQFPIWFGPDGYLFTKDDPTAPLKQGYTLVNLDTNPFTFSREADQSVHIYEGDIGIHDLSKKSYSDAFEGLIQEASKHYPFTDVKKVDWKALHDQFAPRFKEADDKKDPQLYYTALRDFSVSIPDGHIGIFGGSDFGEFQNRTSGSYGFAMTKLDDGSAVASYLVADGAAAKAGMKWGATILKWGDQTVDQAASNVVLTTNWSTEGPRQLQQYRYLTVVPLDSEISVTFQNPGEGQRTASLKAVSDGGAVLRRTSFYYGEDPLALPVEYRILDSGLGYIKLYSTFDDLNLTVRLWERALKAFNDRQVPGLILDLRQNPGGQTFGGFFAGYFVKERTDLTRTFFYSNKTNKFESFLPPDFALPNPDLHYDGKLALLVGPACASACELLSHDLSQLPGVHVVGLYPSEGALGEVGRGQYALPEGWNYQIPDGYVADMQGNMIVEGVGVPPDVKVPITLDNLKAIFVDGTDVVLNTAVETITQELPK